MEFKFICISFALLFFNSAHAVCVPRDAAMSCPNPHAPKNLMPVSQSTSRKPPAMQNSAEPVTLKPSASAMQNSAEPVTLKPSASAMQNSAEPVTLKPSAMQNSAEPVNKTSGMVDAIMSGLPRASGNENPEIKRICDATDFPDVCLSTLGRFNGPTDIPSILGIAIQAGMDFAKAAMDTADKLTTQPGTPKDQVSLLSDCKDSYDDVQYNFQNAHDALPVKDVGTMNTMLSAAITDVGDCQDSFEGLDCPLANFSDKLRMMASNCLAIISQMKK